LRPVAHEKKSLAPRGGMQASSTDENISPKVMVRIMGEIRELQKSPIDGIRVVMNEESVTDVQADIVGPGAAAPLSHPPTTGPTGPARPILPSCADRWCRHHSRA
jgi:hypothetical protein